MRVRIVLFLICASLARSEFLRVEVYIRDMNCESCSTSLGENFKRMRGVDTAEVDFKAATVRLALAEKNRVGVEQIWDAIKRVGFTPGETKVTVRGAVKGRKFEVPEIGKTFEIEGVAREGDSIQLTGVITPPPDPRTPIVIRLDPAAK